MSKELPWLADNAQRGTETQKGKNAAKPSPLAGRTGARCYCKPHSDIGR